LVNTDQDFFDLDQELYSEDFYKPIFWKKS